MKRIKPTRLLLSRMPDLAATQNALAAALVDNDDAQGAIALIDATQDIKRTRRDLSQQHPQQCTQRACR